MSLQRELGQVDDVFGSSDQIDELTHLGLVGSLVEEIDEVSVEGLASEKRGEYTTNIVSSA